MNTKKKQTPTPLHPQKLVASDHANSLSVRVFEELEESILNGSIKPGENLIELKLSAELGVSRTPVREAIRMLEQKGLVQITPNKGAVVLGISEKDLTDIYTIRMYIEGLGSRWAAANITEKQIQELTDIVDLQEFYNHKQSTGQINDLDSRFHEKIFEYSNSRTLQHTLSDLHHMIQRFRHISFNTTGRADKAIEEHRQILEALSRHDADEAERLTVQHIRNAMDNLLNVMKNN
jgi:DNA-binding GntR family transcriptional regulator